MLNIENENTCIKLNYATTKYHSNAIWFDMGKSKSQLSALSLKQELNSCAIVYGDCLLMSFHIIFVDPDGLYCTTVNHENIAGFSYLIDLMNSYLNDFLDDNNDLYIDKCEIKLLKPLKHQRKNKKSKTQRRKTNIPRGLRKEVFKRDNYACKECGARKGDKKPDGSKVVLHVDHVIPVSRGGSDMLDNLQTLCSDCNLNKNNLIQ